MDDRPPPMPLHLPVEPAPGLDLEAVRARLHRRARRRTAGRAAALMAVAVVAGLLVPQVLPDPAPVELAVGDAVLPAPLPDGYQVCAQEAVDDGVVRTELCGPGRPDLLLLQGPHDALPEEGEPIRVARRTGFVARIDGGIAVTVSDANAADDVHHRLSTVDGELDPRTLADVLSTIPSVADAEPSR